MRDRVGGVRGQARATKALDHEALGFERALGLFRQITARRNPNLLILTVFTLAGRPDWGLLAVAWWTVICLVLHGLQLGQALLARRQAPLQSWMAKS